jgi:hypothetical protein
LQVAILKKADYTANFHGIANCFRIFDEQNKLPDPKKVKKTKLVSQGIEHAAAAVD